LALNGPVHKHLMTDEQNGICIVEQELTKNVEAFGRETCPSVTLSTKNPICIDLGLNGGRRGEKLTTD
jgi:hypothetical protein